MASRTPVQTPSKARPRAGAKGKGAAEPASAGGAAATKAGAAKAVVAAAGKAVPTKGSKGSKAAAKKVAPGARRARSAGRAAAGEAAEEAAGRRRRWRRRRPRRRPSRRSPPRRRHREEGDARKPAREEAAATSVAEEARREEALVKKARLQAAPTKAAAKVRGKSPWRPGRSRQGGPEAGRLAAPGAPAGKGRDRATSGRSVTAGGNGAVGAPSRHAPATLDRLRELLLGSGRQPRPGRPAPGEADTLAAEREQGDTSSRGVGRGRTVSIERERDLLLSATPASVKEIDEALADGRRVTDLSSCGRASPSHARGRTWTSCAWSSRPVSGRG